MFKKIFYFLMFIAPVLGQWQPVCQKNCEGVNRVGLNYPTLKQIATMDQCGWFPVKYDTGTFYYHNRLTNLDQWEYPNCHEIVLEAEE